MPWNPTLVGSQILAVHAALVPAGPQGEVVLFGGDERRAAQQRSAGGDGWTRARVYDVATHSLVAATVPSPDTDVFCAHHAFAADGRLPTVGGTSKWSVGGDVHAHQLDLLGHRRYWLDDPRTHDWVEAASPNRNPGQPDARESGSRWYPGSLTPADGDVPALYAVRHLFFPRAFALRDGTVFVASPMPVHFATAASGDGTYVKPASTREPASTRYPRSPSPARAPTTTRAGPAVMLPLLPGEDWRERVLLCVETTALTIDFSAANPQWQSAAARDPGVAGRTRVYSSAALLPTGQVCLLGGVNVVGPEDPVLQAEIYDPGIRTVTESGRRTRNDHSTAASSSSGSGRPASISTRSARACGGSAAPSARSARCRPSPGRRPTSRAKSTDGTSAPGPSARATRRRRRRVRGRRADVHRPPDRTVPDPPLVHGRDGRRWPRRERARAGPP